MSARDPFFVTLAKARQAMGQFHREHKPYVRPAKRGYLAGCSCGWVAREPYVQQRHAISEAVHHLAQSSDAYGPEEAAKDGVSLPESVSPRAQDRPTGGARSPRPGSSPRATAS